MKYWTGGTELRGVNIWQTRGYSGIFTSVGNRPVGPGFCSEDFAEMKQCGINCVFISHPGLFFEDPPYSIDAGAVYNLDDLLSMISAENMSAVIGFRSGPGRSEFTFVREQAGTWFPESLLDESIWQSKEKQQAWCAMWKYTAKRYADKPAVAGFQLMVEPNPSITLNLSEPMNPKQFYPKLSGSLCDWNQLYPKLIDAVRSVDENTPVLIDASGYGSVHWLPHLQKTNDPNAVYAVHFYEPYAYTHQPAEARINWGSSEFTKNFLRKQLSSIKEFTGDTPVVIGEFGVKRWAPGASQYAADCVEIFEENGWNWAWWAWFSKTYPGEEASAFYFQIGADPEKKERSAESNLQNTLEKLWKRNDSGWQF